MWRSTTPLMERTETPSRSSSMTAQSLPDPSPIGESPSNPLVWALSTKGARYPIAMSRSRRVKRENQKKRRKFHERLEALQQNPELSIARAYLSAACVELHDSRAAHEQIEALREQRPGWTVKTFVDRMPESNERKDALRRALTVVSS